MTLHTRLWAEAIVSFSIVLCTAVAILAFRSGVQPRAFRIAFATVGGGYLLLVLCNTFTPIRDLLVTNRALVLAGTALHVPTEESIGATMGGGGFQVADPANVSSASGGFGGGGFTASFNPDEYGWNNDNFAFSAPIVSPKIPAGAFLIIGHCVWSWLLALAAGCFAAFACRPRPSAVA